MNKVLKQKSKRVGYLTVKGTAAYLKMSERTIRMLLTDPTDPLPHFRLGRMIRLRRSEVDSWLEKYRISDGLDIDDIVKDLL